MSTRVLLACGLALIGLGAALGAVAAVSGSGGSSAPLAFAGPTMPPNFVAPEFALTDQHGRRFAMSEARGRVVAMTFIHSRCTSTCPVTLQTIRGAVDDLGPEGGQIEVVVVTVDPEADTPASVRRFLRRQRVGEMVRYLTGPRERMRPIWRDYGIRPQGDDQEDHTAFVLLVDRRGVVRVGFPSHQMTPKDLANDLGILLSEKA